jgi:hypothetical protein
MSRRRPSSLQLIAVALLALCVTTNADAARRRHRPRAAVADTIRTTACDRICLNGFVDRFVEALIAHDPGRAELAPEFRWTENGVSVPPGAGLWQSMTDLGDYRIRAVDAVSGQAALLGVLIEETRPTMFALRLKVVKRRLTEAEIVIARNVPEAYAAVAPRLRWARRIFGEGFDPQTRVPRARMIEAANAYYDGIEQGSGGAVPFAEDCHRIENGIALVNNPGFHFDFASPEGRELPNFAAMACREQFNSGIWGTDRVTERRFPLVDEEQGIVVAFTRYNSHAHSRCAEVIGYGQVCPPPTGQPASLDRAEFFRVGDGRIHEIESVWTVLPPGAGTGW